MGWEKPQHPPLCNMYRQLEFHTSKTTHPKTGIPAIYQCHVRVSSPFFSMKNNKKNGFECPCFSTETSDVPWGYKRRQQTRRDSLEMCGTIEQGSRLSDSCEAA
ncbi:hypothetical protein JTE90_023146 [Oedothorax gibbosus]|uniref:Uncharacterized protein n=1 Tax=Oedothorax gibbosus TaxID=931172 RepID=A0AAV6UQB3_9ARAC|nr:hypothetical protein JTE90_023146 [Oedothorax gibbosus]